MPRSSLLALLLLTVALPGAAQAPGIDLEANRRRVSQLRLTDPEQHERLRRNLERFRALTPAQQERLRELDRELHEFDPDSRERLMHVLSEYESWLARLPEAERQRVQSAAVPDERLRVIREIRDGQWARSQPPARVRQWEQANDSERRQLVAQWRQQERAERDEWAAVQSWEALAPERPTMPMGPDTFRREVTAYIDKHLAPHLTPPELAKISPAHYDPRRDLFGWLRAVAEVADAHPVLALEPKYLRRADLPEEYRRTLEQPPANLSPAQRALADTLPAEGLWPAYPIAVSRLMREWNVPVKTQLGPSTAAEFSPAMEKFVESLPPAEQTKLNAVSGRWPEYPQKLHEIARERKLPLPDIGLPGDPRMWERVRSRPPFTMPDLSEWQLRMFAFEMARKNPEFRNLDWRNPDDREKLQREYNKTRPELQRRPPAGTPDRSRSGRR